MASLGEITYNNERYMVVVKLINTMNSPSLDKVPEEDTVNLPFENIGKMELLNDITDPIMSGTIDFTDGVESYLNGFVGSNGGYVFIGIQKYTDSSVSCHDGIPDVEWSFSHLFIIDGIDMTGRRNGLENYRISFRSSYWWNFMNSKPYSTNNSTDPVPVTEIIKKIFVSNGLPIGTKIKNYKSGNSTREHFITQAGTPMYNSYQDLVSDLNSTKNVLLDGLSLMTYHHMKDEFDLWVGKNEVDGKTSTNDMSNTVYISINQNALNTMLEQNDVKMLLSNTTPSTTIMKELRGDGKWSYDYDNNSFTRSDTTQQHLIESVMKSSDAKYTPKYRSFEKIISQNISNTEKTYQIETIRSVRSTSRLSALVHSLTSNNVVTVSVAGNFERVVGQPIYLAFDINKDAQSSIQYLMGWWTCLRVRNVFTGTSYTSTIMLGRFNALKDIKQIRDVV